MKKDGFMTGAAAAAIISIVSKSYLIEPHRRRSKKKPKDHNKFIF